MNSVLKNFLPAIAWLVLVTVLMVLPGNEFPQETWFQNIWLDKWIHFGLFFVLVYLFHRAVLTGRGSSFRLPTLLIVLAGGFYGIAIEFIQKYWVAGRSFDLGDIVFDWLGSIAAYLVGRQAVKK